MKDSEVYLRAAEWALRGRAAHVLAESRRCNIDAACAGLWQLLGESRTDGRNLRCLFLCFLAAESASEGK